MRSGDSHWGCGAQGQRVPWARGVCRHLEEKQHLHPVVEHHLWRWGTVHLFCQEPKREEPQPQCDLHSYSGGPKYVTHACTLAYTWHTKTCTCNFRHLKSPESLAASVSSPSFSVLLTLSLSILDFFPRNVFLSLSFQWRRLTTLWQPSLSQCWAESLA